ncbi:hypothetical protein TSUD_225380 [Trifolium subterraneum]|uniref:Uncharacterized protein n=1 Tax=Trifolium subterraneum TaxID=3900 RepID=A0A2Z6MR58_TRISU|nr:hypothetical protein TSUD_225380 [Trifolium subterraneum]
MSCNGFSEVELKAMFSEMTFNTIMRMVSGKRYYGNDCDVTDVEQARWFDFDGLEKRLKNISKRADSFLQGLIDEHRLGKRNTNTMIDHLLTQQQSQPEYYTDQIIKGLIVVSNFNYI